MMYGAESRPQADPVFQGRVQGSFPPVQTQRVTMSGVGATEGGGWLRTLIMLGLLGGGAYWIYKTQFEGKNVGSKVKEKVSKAKAKAKKLLPRDVAHGKWFYAEGEKGAFYFRVKKDKMGDHTDASVERGEFLGDQEGYAERISPIGGNVWKVRPVARQEVMRDTELEAVE